MGNIGEQPPQYDLEKARAEATKMEKMSNHINDLDQATSPELRKEKIQFIFNVFEKANEKNTPLYLFASFADDFVLNDGEIKQDHDDVDLICIRNDVQKIITILDEVGCDNIKEEFDNQNYYSSDNLPLKITARHGMIDIDVPIMDFDEKHQQPYYIITNNDGRKFHIYFEKDFFSTSNNSRSTPSLLKTVSPLGLIQTRIFYPALENIEWREHDKKAAEALRDKFFPKEDLKDSKFMPEIVEINS